jgi:hypothetical protein
VPFTVVDKANNYNGSGTTVVVTKSIAAGHTVACIGYLDGTGVMSVTDSSGTNSYASRNSRTTPFGQTLMAFDAIAIAASITSVTLHSTQTDFLALWIWDITASAAIAYADSLGNDYIFNSPITTDGITTGTLNIGTSSDGLLLAVAEDPGGGGLSTGTGFTSDGGVALGDSVSEHKAVSASAAATATDATINSRPIILATLLVIAGGATTNEINLERKAGRGIGRGMRY